VLSFALGATTGAISSYVAVRSDISALTARVVVQEQQMIAVEQNILEWRTADVHSTADLNTQIKSAVDILTELRIRLGPPGPHR
jgi:hypothetical protein